jgi:hypothetical protein
LLNNRKPSNCEPLSSASRALWSGSGSGGSGFAALGSGSGLWALGAPSPRCTVHLVVGGWWRPRWPGPACSASSSSPPKLEISRGGHGIWNPESCLPSYLYLCPLPSATLYPEGSSSREAAVRAAAGQQQQGSSSSSSRAEAPETRGQRQRAEGRVRAVQSSPFPPCAARRRGGPGGGLGTPGLAPGPRPPRPLLAPSSPLYPLYVLPSPSLAFRAKSSKEDSGFIYIMGSSSA